eukprot:CAMPEP_0197445672 /NCGR_PEP_ID=MMETSP1175-20131217/10833_1 /TAXON_ID=1003142 /ORGANISM="Triceratium dubium, Strain CCMP147" /LENGTH=53 /DNA_ID=CAMNT_0042976667 /DNA_START=203 /DNA_END=361 /DNA_ORIENTATION=-
MKHLALITEAVSPQAQPGDGGVDSKHIGQHTHSLITNSVVVQAQHLEGGVHSE